MALFKYYPPTDWAIDALTKCTVRFSPPTEFNDPFDSVPVLLNFDSDRVTRGRYETVMRVRYLREVQQNPAKPMLLADVKAKYPYSRFAALQQENMPRYTAQWHDIYKSTVLSRVGILCLSKNGHSPAMWGHYSKDGSGFLVEYDENHGFFQQHKDPNLTGGCSYFPL